jgi:hypothetical protein
MQIGPTYFNPHKKTTVEIRTSHDNDDLWSFDSIEWPGSSEFNRIDGVDVLSPEIKASRSPPGSVSSLEK